MDIVMNWEAIGAVGEIVGALGVIITLAYLSTQMRQNTKSINSNNANSVMNGFNQLNVALFADPEAARICSEGFAGIDQFSDNEKHRFCHLMNAFFNIYRNLYLQYLDGTFSEDQWNIWALEARQMMQTRGVRYFRKRTRTYEDLFTFLEEMPDSSPQPLSLLESGDN